MINYSFIIPHKNCPDLLKRCLCSIPQRVDIQVIVIDDCSDNKYLPILMEVTKGFEFVRLDKPQGAGAARNVGLSKANGKWVLFADSDDFYSDDFICTLDQYRESDLDVIYFNFFGVYNDSLRPYSRYNKLTKYYKDFDGSLTSLNRIRYFITMPWNKMIRMDMIRRFSLDFELLPKGNDVRFSYMVGFFSRKFAVEKKVLYNWTLQPFSITHQHISASNALTVVMLREKSRAFLKNVGLRSKGRFALLIRYFLYNGIGDAMMIIKTLMMYRKNIILERDNYLRYIEKKTITMSDTLQYNE